MRCQTIKAARQQGSKGATQPLRFVDGGGVILKKVYALRNKMFHQMITLDIRRTLYLLALTALRGQVERENVSKSVNMLFVIMVLFNLGLKEMPFSSCRSNECYIFHWDGACVALSSLQTSSWVLLTVGVSITCCFLLLKYFTKILKIKYFCYGMLCHWKEAVGNQTAQQMAAVSLEGFSVTQNPTATTAKWATCIYVVKITHKMANLSTCESLLVHRHL